MRNTQDDILLEDTNASLQNKSANSTDLQQSLHHAASDQSSLLSKEDYEQELKNLQQLTEVFKS